MDAKDMNAPFLSPDMRDHFIKCLKMEGYRVFKAEKVLVLDANTIEDVRYFSDAAKNGYADYMTKHHTQLIAGQLAQWVQPKFVRQRDELGGALEFRTEVMVVLE